MLEWLAVVLAGAGGGAISTVLPAGTDVPWPDTLKNWIEQRPRWNILAHFLRNTCLGALASFLVWGLATPEAAFSSSGVAVREVAFSIIVGGGGGGIVNNFFRQAQKIEAFSKTIDELRELLDKLK